MWTETFDRPLLPRAAAHALGAAAFLLSLWPLQPASAAPADIFSAHKKGSTKTVDHSAWDALLQAYVVPGSDGINRVRYAKFKSEGRAKLDAYLAALQATDVKSLDKAEQFAFWANLYNAKTIAIVLDAYPVQSIKKINLGGGLLAAVTGGPWKAKVLKVSGEELSLDDIEHGILRPIFKDPRVHYAVNCASIGCPNLGQDAFVGAKLDSQLNAAARAFVNNPRGVNVKNGSVTASSIYSWFQSDFGGSERGVLKHARRFADDGLKSKLDGATGIDDFEYDWNLNDAGS